MEIDTIIPKKNENDLDDLPEEVREQLHFVLVDQIDNALDVALTNGLVEQNPVHSEV